MLEHLEATAAALEQHTEVRGGRHPAARPDTTTPEGAKEPEPEQVAEQEQQ
jgi:hypothetical protein